MKKILLVIFFLSSLNILSKGDLRSRELSDKAISYDEKNQGKHKGTRVKYLSKDYGARVKPKKNK